MNIVLSTEETVRFPPTLRVAALAAAFSHAALLSAQAPDPDLARNLASSCAICHGTHGVSQGVVPSLAGTPKADLVAKLQEYKAGKRAGTIMPQLAKGYTDAQLELMAGWFAEQKK
ncbi:MAG: cytochrome C [Betaproteobacteria bacterium]